MIRPPHNKCPERVGISVPPLDVSGEENAADLAVGDVVDLGYILREKDCFLMKEISIETNDKESKRRFFNVLWD